MIGDIAADASDQRSLLRAERGELPPGGVEVAQGQGAEHIREGDRASVLAGQELGEIGEQGLLLGDETGPVAPRVVQRGGITGGGTGECAQDSLHGTVSRYRGVRRRLPWRAMNVGVLASGAGTNLQALIDHAHGRDGVDIVAVASDKPGALALERAAAAGITAEVFPVTRYRDRTERDLAIAVWLREQGVELVVLAGYMQLLSDAFLAEFPDAVINVHPSLLPAFPGLGAVQQALDYGVQVFGVTVMFVDGGVDTGPVLLQRAVELPGAADAGEVLRELHAVEHVLLPEAVRLLAAGRVRFDPANPRRVLIDR